jgi:LPXTG-motif cell wall-anchored protein
VPRFSRFVVVLAAFALCAPGAALGQTSTNAQGPSGVSTQPPVHLGGTTTTPPPSTTTPAKPAARPGASGLPNTGSDPRLLFLAGTALMLFGVGLRLRTADAELY